MATMAMTHQNNKSFDISYGIYTIERLPKGSKRSPKWDLHSTAKDRNTAENHAKTLSAQPYFDHIEVQEFRVCPETKERTVQKIKTYSRKTSWNLFIGMMVIITILSLLALA